MATLTFVIQNYNQAEFLDRAFEAVLSQSRKPDELIFMDDCSSDNSLEIAEKYARNTRLRIIRNEVNLGVVPTNNKAIESAQSKYVFVLGADDLILPGFIEKSMAALEAFPQAALVCSHPAFMDALSGEIDRHDNWRKHSLQPCYIPPEEAAIAVGPDHLWIAAHTTIFNRDLLIRSGKFPEQLRWHTDWFVLHVLAFRHGFIFLPDPLVALRVAPSSFSSGRHDPIQQSEVLWNLYHMLLTDEFADVRLQWEQSKLFDVHPEYKGDLQAVFRPWLLWAHHAESRKKLQDVLAQNDSLLTQLGQQRTELEHLRNELELSNSRIAMVEENLRTYNRLKNDS